MRPSLSIIAIGLYIILGIMAHEPDKACQPLEKVHEIDQRSGGVLPQDPGYYRIDHLHRVDLSGFDVRSLSW